MTNEEFYALKYIKEIVHPLEHPERFKSNMPWDFMGYAIFCILPATLAMLVDKSLVTKIIFWSCVGIFILLVLFAIYIYSNPYKRQKEIVLFIGMFYLLFSISLEAIALLYTGVLAHLYILAFLFFSIYIALLLYIFMVLIPKMLKGFRWYNSKFYKSKLGRKITGIAISVSSVAGVLGMYFGKVIGNFLSQWGVYIAISFCESILSYLCLFGIQYGYKYYLITKYPQFYFYCEPPKMKSRKTRNAKVERSKKLQYSAKELENKNK
ncbi:hypothetical protein B0S90_0647 [Caldicellulosiruptor bescii]|uniref:Uncharacterized protein n=2 Tax=Caldicellulosiruptor bescii TaxID=31899 RepID=B9MN55_CALBD|nr:hypothetical protein [Caldicellulosiruptor bescii]ACM59511.1 hypothetical protein Athe_0376 [Caldicellulosiruptor bescii DSM 6725]PBC89543.1 hypothetical protein B0S87_2649 [Caldicellulosiruptor bescii]PBC89866.1 hypothetical protein B0S89_0151 [Caldicellulosiruptor bescii]PBD04708.1 hypothetical protein B0S85_2398 [Caldicellulosiruptor bescii]PBD05662.1 hypothetical protein B0S90_0647 [Caldicellulosiruptor bescii]